MLSTASLSTPVTATTATPSLTFLDLTSASTYELALTYGKAFWRRTRQTEGDIALWFGPGKPNPLAVSVPVTDLPAFAAAAAAHEDAELAYCGLAPRHAGTVTGWSPGTDFALHDAQHIFFDFDGGKPGYAPDKPALLAQVLAFAESTGLLPHILPETAHGYHMYFLLSEPMDTPERQALPGRMEAAFLAHLALSGYTMDTGVTTTPTRLGRIPGTWNRKKDLAAPFRTELAAVGEHALYSPDDLLELLPDTLDPTGAADGALPIVYDERIGADLARALPIERILDEVLGWTGGRETAKGFRSWDAHCDAAESTLNGRTQWGVKQPVGSVRTDDGAQALYLYSTTTAAENNLPPYTRLTSFGLLGHTYFNEDFKAAAGLAGAFIENPDKLIELLKTNPTPAVMADLARRASIEWPENLSHQHVGKLKYQGVAADVAAARGYETLPASKVLAEADPALSSEVGALLITKGVGALKVPVYSFKKEVTATLRLNTALTLPAIAKGAEPAIIGSLAGAGYDRHVIDMNPLSRPAAARVNTPLAIVSADLIGRGLQPDPLTVQHGQIHADAVSSAALREGVDLAVASLARWVDGIDLAGTAAANYGRDNVLTKDWARLELRGRTVYIIGRAHWRRSESLIALATLLERKGATVKVVNYRAPEVGPETIGSDNSPWGITDHLAAATSSRQAKPLTGLLDNALELEDAAWQSTPLDDTEVGRAERLIVDLSRARSHRFNATSQLWMENTGTHWAASPAANPSSKATGILRELGANLRGVSGITQPLKLVAQHPSIAIDAIEMGTAAREVNCLNGVVDLETGAIRERTADDLHLTVIPAIYDPEAKAPKFMKFLDDITLRDREYAEYLKRHIGLLLIGEILEEMLFMAVGGGGNGKSVFYGVISKLMAGYATTASTQMLTGDAELHQIADLFAKRFVLASETKEGDRLTSDSIKNIAKRDELTGARKYGHSFDFDPTHTAVLMTNHKPTVTATDHGTWRRLRVLPFNLQLTAEQTDTSLPSQLLNELPGILAWAIEGAKEVLATGLGGCTVVDAASAEYKEDQDLLGRYLREEAHITGNVKDRVVKGQFNKALRFWLTDGEGGGLRDPWAVKTIQTMLKERGVLVKDTNLGPSFCGITMGPAPLTEKQINEIAEDSPAPDSLEVLAHTPKVVELYTELQEAIRADEWEF